MSHLSRQNFVAESPELVLKAAVRQYLYFCTSATSKLKFVAELVLKAAVCQYLYFFFLPVNASVFVHLYQYLKRTLHCVTLSCLLTYANVC